MQTYQATPDYYRDVIQHYYKSKKNHKYISKHKGPSGKWVYVYKNKFNDIRTRFNRNAGIKYPHDITTDYGKTLLKFGGVRVFEGLGLGEKGAREEMYKRNKI